MHQCDSESVNRGQFISLACRTLKETSTTTVTIDTVVRACLWCSPWGWRLAYFLHASFHSCRVTELFAQGATFSEITRPRTVRRQFWRGHRVRAIANGPAVPVGWPMQQAVVISMAPPRLGARYVFCSSLNLGSKNMVVPSTVTLLSLVRVSTRVLHHTRQVVANTVENSDV